jgi:hypothetical protein
LISTCQIIAEENQPLAGLRIFELDPPQRPVEALTRIKPVRITV